MSAKTNAITSCLRESENVRLLQRVQGFMDEFVYIFQQAYAWHLHSPKNHLLSIVANIAENIIPNFHMGDDGVAN